MCVGWYFWCFTGLNYKILFYRRHFFFFFCVPPCVLLTAPTTVAMRACSVSTLIVASMRSPSTPSCPSACNRLVHCRRTLEGVCVVAGQCIKYSHHVCPSSGALSPLDAAPCLKSTTCVRMYKHKYLCRDVHDNRCLID